MAPKEPTRAQLSSRLSYSQHTPSFLRRLQNQVAGHRGHDDDDEEEAYVNEGDDIQFEDYDRGSGRPPIPRRPAIPERPPEDPGSAGEDDEDEKPQVVVIKQGKHLTEREAENIRRKAKGLSPIPDTQKDKPEDTTPLSSKLKESSSDSKTKQPKQPTLSFSTSKSTSKTSAAKRKLEAVGQPSNDEDGDSGKPNKNSKKANAPPGNKKQKKNKTLLSFGDDA